MLCSFKYYHSGQYWEAPKLVRRLKDTSRIKVALGVEDQIESTCEDDEVS